MEASRSPDNDIQQPMGVDESTAESSSNSFATPIRTILPFEKWRLCGLCTSKGDLGRTRNGTPVINFDMTDNLGDSIRLAGFGEQAELVQSVIQINKVYYISRCTVRKMSQEHKRHNNTGHRYQLTMRTDTEITPCDEAIECPPLNLNICPLDQISNYMNQSVDVLAVVDKLCSLNEFLSKEGKLCARRQCKLIDQSGKVVVFILWNNQARQIETNSEGQVIGIKGALVKHYLGDYTLNSSTGTRWEISPKTPEALLLSRWFEEVRPTLDLYAKKSYKTDDINIGSDIRLIRSAILLRLGDEPDHPKDRYMNIKAMVVTVGNGNVLYQACPNYGCKKKAVHRDFKYYCEKCGTASDSVKWCFNLWVELNDLSGTIWVTMFEVAEKLLGKTAQEMAELREFDKDAYHQVLESVRFKYFMWRLRSRCENQKETPYINTTVMDVVEVPSDIYIEELEKSLAILEQL